MSEEKLYKVKRFDLERDYENVTIPLIRLIFGNGIVECCLSLDVGDMYGEEYVEFIRTK